MGRNSVKTFHTPFGTQLIDRLNSLVLSPPEDIIRDKIKALLLSRDRFIAVMQDESVVQTERQIRHWVQQLDDKLLLSYGMRLQDTVLASADDSSIEHVETSWEAPQNAEAETRELLYKLAPVIEATGTNLEAWIADVCECSNQGIDLNTSARLYTDYIRYVGFNPVNWSGATKVIPVNGMNLTVTQWIIKTEDSEYCASLLTQALIKNDGFNVAVDLNIGSADQLVFELLFKNAGPNYKKWIDTVKAAIK